MLFRPEKRGECAALIHTGFPLSLATLSLITSGLLKILPAGSAESPYSQWGWRIPFFFGATLSDGVALYYARRVPESVVWDVARKAASPLKELCGLDNFRRLMQVFIVMSGAWFTLNVVTSILPGLLMAFRHVSSLKITSAQLVANVLISVLFVPFGRLGQRIGRRTTLALIGLAACTAGPVFCYVLVKSGYKNAIELIALLTLVNVCATPVWAIVSSYRNERFPTRVRASGYGIGYSVASIIPVFSSLYMLGLARLGIPYGYTELILLG